MPQTQIFLQLRNGKLGTNKKYAHDAPAAAPPEPGKQQPCVDRNSNDNSNPASEDQWHPKRPAESESHECARQKTQISDASNGRGPP